MVYSVNKANRLLPTVALSTSGVRVEVENFLSACFTSSPVLFCCVIYTPNDCACQVGLEYLLIL